MSIRFYVQSENMKIILKIMDLKKKKKKILQFSYTVYVFVIFYKKNPVVFKFALSTLSENTGPVNRGH